MTTKNQQVREPDGKFNYSGVSKSNWIILKVDLRSYLDKEYVNKKKVNECVVFYLIDSSIYFHICSLTPNLEAWPIQCYVTFDNEEANEDDDGELEREIMENEDICYLNTNVLGKYKYVSADKFLNFSEQEDEETNDNYRARLAQEACEQCCENRIWF